MNELKGIKNSRWFYAFVVYLISLHVLFIITELFTYKFNPKWYFLPEYAYTENFWENIWLLHNNPPFVNIIHGIIIRSGLPVLTVYNVLYSLLHLIAAYWMYKIIQKIKIPFPIVWLFLIMGNPLHVYWFHHYYYPALMFFFSAGILYLLFVCNWNDAKKYHILVFILATMCMTRASYHPFWIALLLLPFLQRIPRKTWMIGLIPLLIPMGWYTKNYVQFGFWGSSSWFGQNISGHIDPHQVQNKKDIANIARFEPAPTYQAFINENDPLIKKYRHIRFLNDTNTLHNVRTVLISRLYFQSTLKHLSIKHSVATIGYGVFSYFGSPLCDEMYNRDYQYLQWNHTWLIDWFDLPNIHVYAENGKYSVIRLSWYLPIYLFSLIFLTVKWKSQPPEIRFILLWLITVTAIYCTIDPHESQRMRYETEPLFYFITLIVGKAIFTKNR